MTYEHAFQEYGNALVFKISRRCPVGCAFCCDPPDQNRLTLPEMLSWTKEAKATGQVSIISFTGGDCFVHFKDMLAVTELAASLDMTVTAITSAYWALDDQSVTQKLQTLTAAGLSRLSFSCDPDHQVGVPLEHVRRALKASIALGLTGFVTGTFSKPGHRVEDFLGPCESQQYRYLNKYIAPYGRAKNRNITVHTYDVPANLDQWGCYRQFGHDILVQPNADVLPCCSTNNTENPLIFGNLRRGDSLSDVISLITGNMLLRVLKHESFAKLRDMTMAMYPESTPLWPDPSSTSGPCGYCAKVCGHQQLFSYICRALAQQKDAYWKEVAIQLTTNAVST